MRRRVDRLEPAAAQPVDRQAADLDRQPGEQERHPGDVPVVLTGLVGAAEDHVLDQRGIDPGPVHDGTDRGGGEVIGPNGCEGAAVSTDGRSNGLDDPRVAERTMRVAGHARIVGPAGVKPAGALKALR